MKTMFATVATTAALFAGAASADSVQYADGVYTVRVDGADIARTADRARVVALLREAAQATCMTEPTRADRAACAGEFAAAAIGGLPDTKMRTALLQTLNGDGAVAVAAAQ